MDKKGFSEKAGIFLSCKIEKYASKEMIMNDHALVRLVSGTSTIVQADKIYTFGPGDTILVPRNQLGRVTKYPADGQPYKAILIYFTQDFLQKYFAAHPPGRAPQKTPAIKIFDTHPLVESLFASILPYFTFSDVLPADIAAIKMEEAITILRAIDKGTDNILGQFEDPGKIDLVDFMEKNYMFNLPMEKFGYLTGRSLTTFKRDFKKAFDTTPQKWLTTKRLELAHHHIVEKKKKPSDIYIEVGFENLSHFSYAFKKRFGYNPTSAGLL